MVAIGATSWAGSWGQNSSAHGDHRSVFYATQIVALPVHHSSMDGKLDRR